ncbi:MAG TPA: DinB family protein [Candidatus Acidoferrales bacterium]|nr:DinB family protein [Candidatus Acidoferrales bacterium]
MNRIQAGAMIALLTLCGTAASTAQDLSQADRDRAVKYLEQTRQGVLDATKGLSAAQWSFKAAPDRWSIAQVMEHIAASEDFIRKLDTDQIMKAPAGDPARDLAKQDAAVLANVPDRSHKVQAPEPLVPTNRFGSPANSVKHFLESRAETENFVKTTAGLRDHVGDSPMGKLDAYEFVLLIAAHSERHTKQILEVKADPNFPKN